MINGHCEIVISSELCYRPLLLSQMKRTKMTIMGVRNKPRSSTHLALLCALAVRVGKTKSALCLTEFHISGTLHGYLEYNLMCILEGI